MKKTSQIYKFIEANRSLDKLMSQNLEYPIKIAYNIVKSKKELDEAIDYVMERFGIVCGNNVDFENISDEQNIILNGILSQEIEIDLPDILFQTMNPQPSLPPQQEYAFAVERTSLPHLGQEPNDSFSGAVNALFSA